MLSKGNPVFVYSNNKKCIFIYSNFPTFYKKKARHSDEFPRDTTFPRATLPRSVSGEDEGARKCRFYVLRGNVM